MCQKKENKKIFFRTKFLSQAPENRAYADTRPGRMDKCKRCGEYLFPGFPHLCPKGLAAMTAKAHSDPLERDIEFYRGKREGRDSF